MTDRSVSVIVPFFNAERFVPQTTVSLARNCAPDIEFVLVDDGSEDNTLAALEQWSTPIDNCRIIQQEENRGPSAARNLGMSVASGRFVTFLDGDDWYSPGHVSQLRDEIVRYGADFVRTDHVQVNGRKREIVRSPERRRYRLLDPRDSILPAGQSTGIDYPGPPMGIYDRRALDESHLRFDEGLQTAEDREWIWRIYLGAEKHVVSGLLGFFYRRGVSDSLTQVGNERQLHFFDSYDRIFEDVARDTEADRFLPKVVRTYCSLMFFHLVRADRLEPELQEELIRRVRETMSRLPSDLLESTLDEMDLRRSSTLRRVHLGGPIADPVQSIPIRAFRKLRRARVVFR